MNKILGRCAVTVLALTTGTAVALSGARPAQAGTITSVTYSTLAPVVDGDAGCGNRTKMTVAVNDPAGDSDYASAYVDRFTDGENTDIVILDGPARSGDTAVFTGWVWLCGHHTPGKYRVTTSDYIGVSHTSYIWLRRPVSLTFNASPEPVRRNTKLTVAGRLMFDPYGPGAKFGAAGQPVAIAFKANGTNTYVSKGTVTTGAGGYYSKKITATGSGLWRATYAGDAAHASVTLWDSVNTN